MAVLSLNTNLSSLKTQRKLAESTASLSKAFERLSSGLRVSRASDDAAGIAIASGLSIDSRVFSQGLRNLSDGVSVANIAEGALNELTNIVLRLQELAEQAANGTLANRQRSSLDAEAQALSKEYFRIAKTTEFNGKKLLDGTVQGLGLQAGYGTNGSLQSSLGGKIGTGTLDAAFAVTTGSGNRGSALGDINGDGILDMVTANANSSTSSVLLGNGDGTFRPKNDISVGSKPQSIALGDINGDGVLDLATGNYTGDSVSILLGNGNGTFRAKTDFDAGDSPTTIALGDLNGDAIIDIVTSNQDGNSVSVLLGNGNGSFKAKADTGVGSAVVALALGDLNGDGVLDIAAATLGVGAAVLLGNGDGSFNGRLDYAVNTSPSVAIGDLNADGVQDLVFADNDNNRASVFLGNGNGTFGGKADFGTGTNMRAASLADLNGDGILDIVTANYDSSTSVLLGNGNGTFKTKTDYATSGFSWNVSFGDLNRDGVLDLVTANENLTVSVLLSKTQDGVSPLLPFSLKTKADAKWALELMKQKLTQLSQQRGIIGANQSRLSTAVANLQVERENYDAARSQITDVDVASESATLVRTRILQQGAAAVLGQANQAPALALKLLSR